MTLHSAERLATEPERKATRRLFMIESFMRRFDLMQNRKPVHVTGCDWTNRGARAIALCDAQTTADNSGSGSVRHSTAAATLSTR